MAEPRFLKRDDVGNTIVVDGKWVRQLYRDKKTGAVGHFDRTSRRRPGHGTRDRDFQPIITVARDFLFRPAEISAAYWVQAPTINRRFEMVDE